MEKLKEMFPKACEKIQPTALLAFGDLDGNEIEIEDSPAREVLFGILTVGKALGEWSGKLFQEGDHLGGLLADALPNDCLFQMDGALSEDAVEMCKERGKGIAADIGTTTVAMQLVDLSEEKVVDVYTAINRQRSYGADVISWIEASNLGKGEELKACIREDLTRGIQRLTKEHTIKVSRMVISANAVMVHLLMGYSCETLGVYPFRPVNIDIIHLAYRELFQDDTPNDVQSMEIMMIPGISTYVGGDIVAGLYALEFERRGQISVKSQG